MGNVFLSFLICFLFSQFGFAKISNTDASITSAEALPKIMLDPGHGGTDGGAKSGNLKEAAIVLDFANELKKYLEEQKIAEVFLTRSADKNISLVDRVRKARHEEVDLFLSLHANSAPTHLVRGIEVFIPDSVSPEPLRAGISQQIVDDLTLFAKKQQSFLWSRKLKDDLQNLNQVRVKTGDFLVLKHASSPSLLFEIGFITNPKDQAMIRNPKIRAEMIAQIADTVREVLADQRAR